MKPHLDFGTSFAVLIDMAVAMFLPPLKEVLRDDGPAVVLPLVFTTCVVPDFHTLYSVV